MQDYLLPASFCEWRRGLVPVGISGGMFNKRWYVRKVSNQLLLLSALFEISLRPTLIPHSACLRE